MREYYIIYPKLVSSTAKAAFNICIVICFRRDRNFVTDCQIGIIILLIYDCCIDKFLYKMYTERIFFFFVFVQKSIIIWEWEILWISFYTKKNLIPKSTQTWIVESSFDWIVKSTILFSRFYWTVWFWLNFLVESNK